MGQGSPLFHPCAHAAQSQAPFWPRYPSAASRVTKTGRRYGRQELAACSRGQRRNPRPAGLFSLVGALELPWEVLRRYWPAPDSVAAAGLTSSADFCCASTLAEAGLTFGSFSAAVFSAASLVAASRSSCRYWAICSSVSPDEPVP